MRRLLMVSTLICALAVDAGAQMKNSGTIACAMPTTRDTADVGDAAGHVIAFNKQSCSWPTPMSVAGAKATSSALVVVSEFHGAKQMAHGFNTTTYDNGDKTSARFEAHRTLSADGTSKFAGTFTYVSGTGKFAGIKGGGTFSGTGAADGTSGSEVKGHYTLGGPGRTKKAM